MRVFLLAITLLAVTLAGCSEGSAPSPEEETTAVDDQLKATDTTGVIRGVVVDNAIVPVAGAIIAIPSLEIETESVEDGSFGFSDLEPGTYILEVSKPGFLPVQSQASVEAGVDKPPVVRVQIAVDAAFNPYSDTRNYRGFYQCGTAAVVVCAAPNILLGQGTTDDTSTPDIYFEETPDFVQTEMVWESTQAASSRLYFEMESLHVDCPDRDRTFLENAEGDSPIRARVNRTVLDEAAIGGDCPIYFSVFAGDELEGAHCFAWPDRPHPAIPIWLGCPGVGFSIQQDFTWYITEFHGYEPPEDWWFSTSGSLAPPQ